MSKMYVNEILHKTSGNYVDLKNPFIYLYKNGAMSTLSEGSRTQITGWTEGFSEGLSLSGNGVTVDDSTAGIYYCSLNVGAFDNGNQMGDARCSILVDGTRKLGSYNMIVSGGTSSNPFDLRHFRINTNGILQLTSGQTVTFDVLLNGNDVRVQPGDTESTQDTNFLMFRLGA